MIYRRLWDKSLPTFGKMFEVNIEKHINSHKDGYDRLDFALVAAGWTVYEKFPHAFTWERMNLMDLGYGTDWMKKKYPIEDTTLFTKQVKKAAKFRFGAFIRIFRLVFLKAFLKSGFSFMGSIIFAINPANPLGRSIITLGSSIFIRHPPLLIYRIQSLPLRWDQMLS